MVMKKVLLVGCGNMGAALLSGWLDEGIDSQSLIVVDPSESSRVITSKLGVHHVESSAHIPTGFQPKIIVFAVKPQVTDIVVPAYNIQLDPGAIFVSIVAGRSISYFEGILGNSKRIVRAMPNTPASVRRAISVACANANVSNMDKKICDEALRAVGKVTWIENEGLLDAVTAISGSGPAYVFFFIECLAYAGEKLGLPKDLAMDLARSTVVGSGELARISGDSIAELRKNVTSRGGTTEAALKVFMADGGLSYLMTAAVKQAEKRSRELRD